MRPSGLLCSEQQQGKKQREKGFAQGPDRAILTYLAARETRRTCQICRAATVAKTRDKFGSVQNRAPRPEDNGRRAKLVPPVATCGVHLMRRTQPAASTAIWSHDAEFLAYIGDSPVRAMRIKDGTAAQNSAS